MSTTSALSLNLILFLLFGGIIWTLNITGQSIFPGNNLFPFIVRSVLLIGLLVLTYYVNYVFSKKNALSSSILNFEPRFIGHYLSGSIVAVLLIATIFTITYMVYPFEIIKNPHSNVNLATDIISYSLGNTLEELLFRGFLLIACVKLFGKIGGILLVSVLFGLFHLQGTGLTREGFSMVMTTGTMSLLFISIIYCTKSIWTAVLIHITGNLLLHSFGFDAGNGGIFRIKFAVSNVSRPFIPLIFEIVVITFALLIFFQAKKRV